MTRLTDRLHGAVDDWTHGTNGEDLNKKIVAMQTALEGIEKRLQKIEAQLSSFYPEKQIEEIFNRLGDILRIAIQEAIAQTLRKNIGKDDLFEIDIYGLKVGSFYPAVVDNIAVFADQRPFGFFIHLLNDQGRRMYFNDEYDQKIPHKGLVHKSDIMADKTVDDFTRGQRLPSVIFKGFKIKEGLVKLCFAIMELERT